MTLETVLRRPGRPRREEDRRILSTFLPAEMKQRLKDASRSESIPFSDWVMKRVQVFLSDTERHTLTISRTHPRSRNWPNQNIKFSIEMAEWIQSLANERDVSVSSLLLALLTMIDEDI
jgi:predicted DNA-binding protein